MARSKKSTSPQPAREKFLGLSLESTRKSYYPQLQAQLSALRESETRMRLLADNLPARISFVDADQCFQFVNREYERALQRKREKMVGRHLKEVFGSRNYAKIKDQVAKALAGEHVRFEVALTRRDGSTIWLEANYVPFVEADGRVSGFYDLTHDLTERKRTEMALRESEAKNRALVKYAPAGIYEIDLVTNRFTSVNDVMCDYTGYSETEFMELAPEALLVEQDQAEMARRIEALEPEQANPPSVEYSVVKKDGGEIRVLVNARYFFERGVPKRAMAVAHDVTAIREAEAAKKQLDIQLQETQKLEALGTLAGGITHDFNNLLMGIQGNASLGLLDADPNSRLPERLRNIEQYVQRGVELTRQLLGLARGGKYEVKPTDLNELISTSAGMFARTKKEIQVQYKLADQLWVVEVDRGQIEQVLLNLLINAWHAMPDGGDVSIQTRNTTLAADEAAAYSIAAGRYVCASVADSGVGIDPAIRRKIFDPFFTTKGVGKGSGLGLASAYGIIKNHQGVIDVQSTPGTGSLFFFYLPATDKAVAKAPSPVEALSRGRETILLVDDERMVLDVGGELLEKLGYTVRTADSSQRALDIYTRYGEQIDLVVLDMIMPKVGGSDTFDRLKELDPDVQVLLSSGYSVDGQAAGILKRGCAGFIQKPFTIATFSKKLREILG